MKRFLLFLSLLATAASAQTSQYVHYPASGPSLPLTTANGGTGAQLTLTQGSVLFASGAAAVVTQDNTNLFWDANNLRLGLLTNPPQTTLDVNGTINTTTANNGIYFSLNGGYSGGLNMRWQAYAGVKTDWYTAAAGNSAMQNFDNSSTDGTMQIIARNSRSLALTVDGTAVATGVIARAAASQTSPIMTFQDAVPNTVFAVKYNGHLTTTQAVTSPAAVVLAAAGTSATCAVSHATDVAGIVAMTTTATSPSSGAQCVVRFGSAFGVAPVCLLTPASTLAATLEVINGTYVTATAGGLSIAYTNADAAGHANTWNYHCIETQ